MHIVYELMCEYVRHLDLLARRVAAKGGRERERKRKERRKHGQVLRKASRLQTCGIVDDLHDVVALCPSG